MNPRFLSDAARTHITHPAVVPKQPRCLVGLPYRFDVGYVNRTEFMAIYRWVRTQGSAPWGHSFDGEGKGRWRTVIAFADPDMALAFKMRWPTR